MVLGGVLAWRQVSMKVLWWLAFASMISDAFKFFCLSSRKVWFICFGCRLMDVCSSNSLSISLVPSMDLFKIPLRFSAHADPGSPVSIFSSSTIADGPGGLSSACSPFDSSVDNVMSGWDTDVGWLEGPYSASVSWSMLRLFWLAVCGSWLCLDLCLVIGGVLLLEVLVLGVFFFVTMIGLLVDIAKGWGSSFLFNGLGVARVRCRARLRTLGSLANVTGFGKTLRMGSARDLRNVRF